MLSWFGSCQMFYLEFYNLHFPDRGTALGRRNWVCIHTMFSTWATIMFIVAPKWDGSKFSVTEDESKKKKLSVHTCLMDLLLICLYNSIPITKNQQAVWWYHLHFYTVSLFKCQNYYVFFKDFYEVKWNHINKCFRVKLT